MNTLYNFAVAHPVLWTAIVTFTTTAIGYVWSAFISALPAPTATSTTSYQFWFRFFNYLAANIARAKNTAVENSPNFQAAVNALPGPVNKPVVIVEAPTEKP